MAPDGSVGSAFTGPVESTPARTTTTTTGEQDRRKRDTATGFVPEPRTEREAALIALESEIATSAAHVAVATHRLLTAMRQFDEMTGWADYAARSCAHWLSWRIGMSPGIAREKLRVARALGRLPKIDEALRTAQISYSKARALTRVATPENEAELLVTAASATAVELERVCRRFRSIAVQEIEKRPHALADERWVRFRPDDVTGFVRMTAQLPPEQAALLRLTLAVVGSLVRKRAAGLLRQSGTLADRNVGAAQGPESSHEHVEMALPRDPSNAQARTSQPIENCGTTFEGTGGRSLGALARQLLFDGGPAGSTERSRKIAAADGAWFSPAELEQLSTFTRADALLAVCESFLERAALAERRLPRYEVVVQVQRDALAGTSDEPALLEDGTAIGAETARRLSCDCAFVRVETDGAGNALDVGRRTRSVPTAIQRALRLRDTTCRFPGCMQDVSLDAHHIQHWAQGGSTRLGNLVRLCGMHHWYVHEGGGSMRMVEGEMLFFDPRGRRIENAPPLTRGGNPSDELRAWLREHGPGEGIALPLPISCGDPADWSTVIEGWAVATYGCLPAVSHDAIPFRMPNPDGTAPPPLPH